MAEDAPSRKEQPGARCLCGFSNQHGNHLAKQVNKGWCLVRHSDMRWKTPLDSCTGAQPTQW